MGTEGGNEADLPLRIRGSSVQKLLIRDRARADRPPEDGVAEVPTPEKEGGVNQAHGLADKTLVEEAPGPFTQSGDHLQGGTSRGDAPSLRRRGDKAELQYLRPQTQGEGQVRQVRGKAACIHETVRYPGGRDAEAGAPKAPVGDVEEFPFSPRSRRDVVAEVSLRDKV